MDVVEDLVDAPDRDGWRGNAGGWVRRARRFLDGGPDAAAVARLAAVVDAWQLLRPAVACLAPLRVPAMWRDAQHMVLVRPTAPPGTTEGVDVWIGCLVYVVRHRPRLGGRLAWCVRPPSGTLARALDDACWAPGATPPDLRAKVLAVLAVADRRAPAALVRDAAAWVYATDAARRHRCIDELLLEALAGVREPE
jgi:hypothetical protein